MPGKKDCLSVLNELGKKETKQKRLVLENLNEIFQHFKEKFPDESFFF